MECSSLQVYKLIWEVIDLKPVWIRSLQDSNIDPSKYIFRMALPTILGSALCFFLMVVLFPGLFGGPYLVVLFSISLAVIISTFILIPFIKWQNRRKSIEQEMHLFITRVGVLTTSDISRKGIFDIMLEMKEYGELAREINKIYILLDKWGLSIGDACRRIAKSTPSIMFGDFLERLAYAVESGEEPRDFFASEQEIILEQYHVLYEQAADTIAVAGEIFIAISMVMTFLILIVALLPFILGINTTAMFYLTALLFIVVECLMLYVFVAYVPRERVWQDTDIRTKVSKKLDYYFVGSLGTCVILGIIIFVFMGHTLPFVGKSFPISTAITLTPLIVTGYYTRKMEEEIIRRDNNFAAFIRSLGSTTETSSIAPVQALKRLLNHDFGPLTQNVKALFDRVSLRIDPVLSWKYFGAETGSDLITKFSGMFVRGLEAGGKPGKASNIISFNFTKLLGLRQKRYSIASSLSGLFIGIAIVISIVMFMASALVEVLDELVTKTGANKSYIEVDVLFSQAYNIDLFINLMFVLVVVHAGITALIHIIVAAGHKYGAFLNFVIMIWIGAVMSKLAPWVIKSLLG